MTTTANLEQLLQRFGTAKAVFDWAERTNTDLLSRFDLTDAEFDELKEQAGNDD